MSIERMTVRELPGEAVRAMDGLRRKAGGAIKCDQQWITTNVQGVYHVVPLTALENRHKHRITMARHERIAQGAALLVTGHLLNTKQGLDIITTLGVLQPALIRG